MKMGYLTSGNEIVDAMGTINISGNIIPSVWYKTITKESGKPYLLAIVILADIVYWYRPTEVRDQGTGHILGWKKKFSEDILRQSYQYYAELFGESKKTVKMAMDRLEQLQVIRRQFRTVAFGEGLISNNVMYVELRPQTLYRLTFPEKIPAADGEDIPYAGGAGDKMGGSLPTKPNTPMEILGGRGIPNGIQVSPGTDIAHDRSGHTLLTDRDTGNSQSSRTNTYISPDDSSGDFNPIYSSDTSAKRSDREMDADRYRELIKRNIEYDHHMAFDNRQDRELFEELYEVICEIVCVRHTTVRIGGEEYPYEIVKSRFLKLDSGHLEYVMGCMRQTTAKIGNIKAYMITALFNAPSTINHYYQQEVQHDMYGGGWADKGIFTATSGHCDQK